MQSNLALITTLYNSRGADFYKDIYFPLIRYSVKSLSYETDGGVKHYDILGLQDRIKEKAGITIPLQVLRNSLRLLSSTKSLPFSVSLYEDSNYFRVSGDLGENSEEIDNASDEVSSQYRMIEMFFQEYLDSNLLTSSKSLLDFFNDNSDDVLKYLEEGNALPVINQEYVNVVRFIQWLKDYKKEYYEVVNNLLWGSIVAGFLQRSNVDLAINTIEKIDYYLDTSIVLGALGLNSQENIVYSQELIRIITEAGSRPLVHSLTVREIKRILEQIEISEVPRSGSSIEQAWIEQDLQLSDILHIHHNLDNLIREAHIIITPISDTELDRIEEKYKANLDVKSLAVQRDAITDDKFREIHDVYMRDFVQKINQTRGNSFIEKQVAYFVTHNADLISFANSVPGRVVSVIHASKVVMNLWLHSSRSENIRQAALAEVMTRCYALNQTDARQKLKSFYKYFKDCSLTSEDIQNMYGSLVVRSANTITAVDKLIENENSDAAEKEKISREIIEGLKAAVDQERKDRNDAIATANHKVSELARRTELLESALEEGHSSSLEKDAIIRKFEDDQGANNETIARLEKELKTMTQLKQIGEELWRYNEKKHELEKERDKSVKYFKFWLIITLEALAIIALLFCLVMAIITWIKNNNWKNIYTWFTLGLCVSLLTMVKNLSSLYILAPGPSKMKVRDEQRLYWEDNHPEYQKVLRDISDLEAKKRALEVI